MNRALSVGTTRFVLIRHGEPEEAAAGRCYGRMDFELSPRGAARASELALAVDGLHTSRVYSSPRRRALATARPLAERRGVEVEIRDGLCEIDFGILEGLTYDEVAERHPDLYAAWMSDPTSVTFPGGESQADLQQRVLPLLEDLKREHSGEAVVIVSHAGVLRTVLGNALRMTGNDLFRLDLSYGGITIVDYTDSFALVRLMNGNAVPMP